MRKIKLVAIGSIILCGATLGYLGWKIYRTNSVPSILAKAKKSLFSRVVFNTTDSKTKNKVEITAAEVQKEGVWFKLIRPDITLHKKGDTINVKSDQLLTDRQVCKLVSNVQVNISKSISLRTDYAYVDINRQFAKGDNRVYITYNNIKAQSEKYLLNLRQNQLDMRDSVRIRVEDKLLIGNHFRCYFRDKNGAKLVDRAAINGNVIYKSNTHSFTTNGLVDFRQNTIFFRSPTVINGMSGKKKYRLEINAAEAILKNNKIQRINCRNKFKLFSDKNIVSGDTGILEKDIVDILGNVEIKTPQGVARGKKARYNIKTGKLTMQNAGGVLFRKKKDKNVAIRMH